MYFLDDSVKVRQAEVKIGSFYIRLEDNAYATLSICLGKCKKLRQTEFYFYDVCALLLAKKYKKQLEIFIPDLQTFELQSIVDISFTKVCDSCSFKTVKGPLANVFKSPQQYNVNLDLNMWYLKSRMVNKELPDVEQADSVAVNKDDAVAGKLYAKGTYSSYCMYLGVKDKKYQFVFFDAYVGNSGDAQINCVKFKESKTFYKCYELESMLQTEKLSEFKYLALKKITYDDICEKIRR